jgi:hypothetical protein
MDHPDPIAEARDRGRREALYWLVREATRELGLTSPEADAVRLLGEKERAVEMLRELCESFGNPNWESSLELGDIIERHLAPYLDWTLTEPGADYEAESE